MVNGQSGRCDAERDRLFRDTIRSLVREKAQLLSDLAAAHVSLERLEKQVEHERVTRSKLSETLESLLNVLKEGSDSRTHARSTLASAAHRLGGALQRWRLKRVVIDRALVDPDWYIAQYPDVASARVEPIAHFIRYGIKEGRVPRPDFSWRELLSDNPKAFLRGRGALVAAFRAWRPMRVERGICSEGMVDGSSIARTSTNVNIQNLVPEMGAVDPAWSPCDYASAFPGASRDRIESSNAGICVIRASGVQPELLSRSLRSVLIQGQHVTPCIVVDGARHARFSVETLARGIMPNCAVLYASDESRGPGHALNVALAYVRQVPSAGFVCFLEEGEIVYPNFASHILEALRFARADIILAQADEGARRSAEARAPGMAGLPISDETFASCVYVIRGDALQDDSLCCREDLESHALWDFALCLIGRGATWFCSPEVVVERRAISAPDEACAPGTQEECRQIVLARARWVEEQLRAMRARFEMAGLRREDV